MADTTRQNESASSLKQYGSTNIGGESRAHLGDVHNNIAIAGDVHVHMPTPVTMLTTANAGLRAAAMCQHFLDLSRIILHPPSTRQSRWVDNVLKFERLMAYESLSTDLSRLEIDWSRHLKRSGAGSALSSKEVGTMQTGQKWYVDQ